MKPGTLKALAKLRANRRRGTSFDDFKTGYRLSAAILDLRKAGYVIITDREPMSNGGNRANNHNSRSKYKGVAWKVENNKWQARIRIVGKQHHIGLFDTEEDAAYAYNQAAILQHGNFARLNTLPKGYAMPEKPKECPLCHRATEPVSKVVKCDRCGLPLEDGKCLYKTHNNDEQPIENEVIVNRTLIGCNIKGGDIYGAYIDSSTLAHCKYQRESSAGQPDERTAFEAWAKTHGLGLYRKDSRYEYEITESAWQGWCARANRRVMINPMSNENNI